MAEQKETTQSTPIADAHIKAMDLLGRLEKNGSANWKDERTLNLPGSSIQMTDFMDGRMNIVVDNGGKASMNIEFTADKINHFNLKGIRMRLGGADFKK